MKLTPIARRATMIYWVSSSGTIRRAESRHADLIRPGDDVFAAPFASNSIVGRNLFDFIAGEEVSHLYQALTARVLKNGHTVNFAYRCDGPRTRREMSMQMSRDGGMVRYESALVRETPRQRELPLPTLDAATFVAICSFCQNYRFPTSSKVWKELEDLLMEHDLPTQFRFTHGICDHCYPVVMRGFGDPVRCAFS